MIPARETYMPAKMALIAVIFSCMNITACASHRIQTDMDENSDIPLAEQFSNKRAIEREMNRVKELIYEEYNATAAPGDRVICKLQYSNNSSRKVRVCATEANRDEMSEVAKGTFCEGTSAYGCDKAFDTKNIRLVNMRADEQMRRINREIISMSETNEYIKNLLARLQALETLYAAK